MRRLLATALLALLTAGPARPTALDPGRIEPKAPAERVTDSLNEALGRLRTRPAAEVLTQVQAILASPDFARLEPKKRGAALLQASALAVRAGDNTEALRLMAAATEADPANPLLWQYRLAMGRQLKSTDAIIALSHIARAWPTQLHALSDDVVLDITAMARDRSDPHALDLLEALYAARWTPSDPLASASAQWRDLVLLLVKAGQADRALAVVGAISDPYALISLRVDRRADGLVAAAPERFDVVKLAQAQLDDLRLRADADTGRLEIVNGEVVALLKRNRIDEALALTDRILKRVGDATQAVDLADLDSEAPWTHTYRAYALRALGREQDAESEMQIASQAQAHGDFYGAVNLADFYARSHSPDKALQAGASIPALGGDGQMQAEWAKACAYAQKGDASRRDDALAYLRDHENDSLDALTNALLCDNRLDELAKLYIRRLGNEVQRADTLLAAQRYAPPPSRPAFEMTLEARRTQVLGRPDVSAAIKAAGRIEAWPLQMNNY